MKRHYEVLVDVSRVVASSSLTTQLLCGNMREGTIVLSFNLDVPDSLSITFPQCPNCITGYNENKTKNLVACIIQASTNAKLMLV